MRAAESEDESKPEDIRNLVEVIVALESGMRDSYNMSLMQWMRFCGSLKAHGILGCLVESVLRAAPAPVGRLVEKWDAERRLGLRARVEALAAFTCEARRNDLHFIVLKGMALSAAVYGATHSGLGARWEPDYTGIRPSQSPICLMRWYVTEDFSDALLELLENAFYNQVLSLLQSNLIEEAVEAIAKEALAITAPEAWAIASALKSLLEIFGLVQMAQFNQVVRDNLGGDYLMVVYDYGDGGSPRLTSNLETHQWNGGAVKGEPGYAGTFTDNSTFTAAAVYHE